MVDNDRAHRQGWDRFLESWPINRSPRPLEPHCKWRPWSRRNPISYDERSSPAVGPGELKLAWELGTRVPRTNAYVDYDVEDRAGGLWEVKAITSSCRTFRGGSVARARVSVLRSEIACALDELAKFLVDPLLQSSELFDLREFMLLARESVSAGNVSRTLLFGGSTLRSKMNLVDVCVVTSRLLKRCSAAKVNVKLLGRCFEIDRLAIVRAFASVDACHGLFSAEEVSLSALEDPIWNDHLMVADLWDKYRPLTLFVADISGAVVVDRARGFFVIPYPRLNEFLEFRGITKNDARLKFTG